MALDPSSFGNAVQRLREGVAIPTFLQEAEHFAGIVAAVGMTAAWRLDIIEAYRSLVLDTLRAHLPDDSKIWVFGSRAAGRARRYFHLDLAIDAGRPLTLDEAACLSEAFSDSDLPYRVDIIDWQVTADSFRRLIAAERVPLVEADRAGPAQG